jgi:hypothetical protein
MSLGMRACTRTMISPAAPPCLPGMALAGNPRPRNRSRLPGCVRGGMVNLKSVPVMSLMVISVVLFLFTRTRASRTIIGCSFSLST